MRKKVLVPVIILLLLAGGYFLLKGGSAVPQTSETPASSPKLERKEVVIRGSGFLPETITVKIDTEIVWINEDSSEHKIVIDFGGGSKIEGKAVQKGEQYSLIFREKREYDYYCDFNPSMKGKIIVVE